MSESRQQLSPSQIIDYVVNHYKNNPRSKDKNDTMCLYNDHNGTHCAFAIMCENPKQLTEGIKANQLLNKRIAKLKPEFSGQSNGFYNAIQMLHDYSDNWERTLKGNKLTQKGIKEVEWLKETYK